MKTIQYSATKNENFIDLPNENALIFELQHLRVLPGEADRITVRTIMITRSGWVVT